VIRQGLLVLVATSALLAAGCGGDAGEAKRELRQTAARLDTIRSGNLDLRLVVLPATGTKGRVGFTLRGPFALRQGGLPVADITYTQLAGARSSAATFVSNGTTAYAKVGSRKISLPPAATDEIKRAAGSPAGTGTLSGLRIDTWLRDPSISDGGSVGGADTDHVSAKLDVVNAANGLLGFVRQLGRDAPTISGDSANRLENAVKSSSVDVWTGKRDHLLRRLLLKVKLGFDVPSELKRALGQVVGASVVFDLAISNPNRPVHVPGS
jgi:hypothetical protein